MSSPQIRPRVLSGMRPTGALHLGHYHGALKNWVSLQDTHQCFFFIADWHALTTHYEERGAGIVESSLEMLVDWLAAGLDPQRVTLFAQSQVPEHAELFTLLAMVTPLSWLERVPTYKEQIERLRGRDLSTYGFLGYPLLQAADILLYRAHFVPVGEDQSSHVEMTREIARRFNDIFGRADRFASVLRGVLSLLSRQDQEQIQSLRDRFARDGSISLLSEAESLLLASSLDEAQREAVSAWMRGAGAPVLREPQILLTQSPRLPGLDGGKMSKSYGNTIALRESPESVASKLKRMATDPARARRSDKGNPERCPVWKLHEVYTDEELRVPLRQGCTSAGIGCLDCKKPLIESVSRECVQRSQRAAPYLARPELLREILDAGAAQARQQAQETLHSVRAAMGLNNGV